jgi:hypothetical protein
MNVAVQPCTANTLGSVYQMGVDDPAPVPQNVTTQLAADATQIVILGTQATPSGSIGPITAPSSGLQQVYLLEAQISTHDAASASVMFVNTNGSQSFSTVPTLRVDAINYQLKAGTPATSSPQTPAADAGWLGIAKIAITSSTTSIVQGQITMLPSFAGYLQNGANVTVAGLTISSSAAGCLQTNAQGLVSSLPCTSGLGSVAATFPLTASTSSSTANVACPTCVTSVTGAGPVNVSAGTTPTVSLGVVDVAHGGTGSATQNFVDLGATAQVKSGSLTVAALTASSAGVTVPSGQGLSIGTVPVLTATNGSSTILKSAGTGWLLQNSAGSGNAVSITDAGVVTASQFAGSLAGATSGTLPNAALVTPALTGITAGANISAGTGTTPTIGVVAAPTFAGAVTATTHAATVATAAYTWPNALGGSNLSSVDLNGSISVAGVSATLAKISAIGVKDALAVDAAGQLGVAGNVRTAGAFFGSLSGATSGTLPNAALVTPAVTAVGAGSNAVIGGTSTVPTVGVVSAPSFAGAVTASQFNGSLAGATSSTLPNAALVTPALTSLTCSANVTCGTGTTPTVQLVAAPTISGANVTAGTLPNAALVTSAVTSVTASGNLASSGGTTPAITMAASPSFTNLTLAGTLSGATTGSFSGAVSAGSLSLSGAITGATTGGFSGAVTGASFTGAHSGSGAGLTAGTVPNAALVTTPLDVSSTAQTKSGALTASQYFANAFSVGPTAGQIAIGTDGNNGLFRLNPTSSGSYQLQSAIGTPWATFGPSSAALSGSLAMAGALSGATTGGFSGLVTASGGVAYPINSAATAGTNTATLGVDGGATAVLHVQNGGSGLLKVQNADGTTTYATIGTASNTLSGSLAIGGALTGATTGAFSSTVSGSSHTASNGSGTNAFVAGANNSNVDRGLVYGNTIASNGWTMVGANSGTTIAGIAATAFKVTTTNSGFSSFVDLLAEDASGNVGIAGNYFAASERRLKNNIVPFDGRTALDLARATAPVRYCYKTEKCRPGETRHIGFIADDTPTDLAPGHKAMDVNATAMVALAGVRALELENRVLRASVAKLERLIASFKRPAVVPILRAASKHSHVRSSSR